MPFLLQMIAETSIQRNEKWDFSGMARVFFGHAIYHYMGIHLPCSLIIFLIQGEHVSSISPTPHLQWLRIYTLRIAKFMFIASWSCTTVNSSRRLPSPVSMLIQ